MFDAQVFQTPAWHRGMGKYSLELIKSIVERNKSSKQWGIIDIIVSSQKPIDTDLQRELESLPLVVIHKLDLAPNNILNPSETSEYNRRTINKFVLDQQGDVTFVILSLMQGEISPTFPTTKAVHKSVLFYDLIPLMFHKTYLQNPITRKEYLSKLEELLRADTFLAISKTVANDLSVYLGIDPSCVVSIDGGPIAHDVKTEPIEVPHPFILMPTGNDLRKNNRKGIEGFNLFNKKYNNKYTLVITSYFEDWQIEELSQLSDKIVFTGNISGAQLNYLYKNAELMLFPSLYEGLGLPVLEALENNIPVACSDITVFREISQTAFSFFNPYKTHSIATAVERSIQHGADKDISKKILQKYSWENTAKITEKVLARKPSLVTQKAKITIITPDVSSDSRVGKMILQAHASFNRLFDITYYEAIVPNRIERRINFLPYIADIHHLSFGAPIEIDSNQRVPIYHIVNQKDSALVMLVALATPGVVVLHDIDLQIVWDELKERNLVSVERYGLEAQIDEAFSDGSTRGLGSLVSHQQTVIVFSRKAEKILRHAVEVMKKDTKIIYLNIPANNLVYSDIISTKKEKTVRYGDIRNTDDMEYEVVLSDAGDFKASSTSVSTNDILPSIEAKKYREDNLPGYEAYAYEVMNSIKEIR